MKLIIILGLVGFIYCLKRNRNMSPGGYRKINPSTIPDVVLSAAQKKLDAQNLDYTERNLDMFKKQIVRAEQQIMSALNYYFTVQLHTTEGREECDFDIYYQSWTSKLKVNRCRCRLMRNRRTVSNSPVWKHL